MDRPREKKLGSCHLYNEDSYLAIMIEFCRKYMLAVRFGQIRL